eukprot:1161140-Pelagomonas_calceolata.AAC.14
MPTSHKTGGYKFGWQTRHDLISHDQAEQLNTTNCNLFRTHTHSLFAMPALLRLLGLVQLLPTFSLLTPCSHAQTVHPLPLFSALALQHVVGLVQFLPGCLHGNLQAADASLLHLHLALEPL